MPTPADSPGRALLFGLLALRAGALDGETLLDVVAEWLARPARPLSDELAARGLLAPEQAGHLDSLVEERLARFNSSPPPDPLGSTVVGAEESSPGDFLAPAASAGPPADTRYRRLRLHARGGLGEVFAARDEELDREVALKEIQDRYADQPEARGRFVREALITGALEHPGVVPVYGLGEYPDGRPYYAMRFIRGESLHDAIQRFHQADSAPRLPGERELALRSLLTRFVAVCNAVGYAHSRGVIHRDLKPANVMLGDFGETLVVDWGLARPAREPDAETTAPADPVRLSKALSTTETAAGQAMGTPAYMPPEQALGWQDHIGPASDIYSLGGVLYCLLTGRPPHRSLGDAALGEPAPARQVNPRAPAALEAACARAMAPRPADRYPTARQLADEVERWLADEPVTAYPEPLPQKARRWAKRHRTLVSSAAVLLVTAVAGLALGLWAVNAQKVQTERARDVANDNAEKATQAEAQARANLTLAEHNLTLARQAVDECFGVARDHALLQRPAQRPVRDLLFRKALPFYKGFRLQRPDDPALAEDVADRHRRIAIIQDELGDMAEAEREYALAERAYRDLAAAQPATGRFREDLAAALHGLGRARDKLGRPQAARQSYVEALGLRRAVAKARPDDVRSQTSVVTTLIALGNVERDLGRRPQALQWLDEACSVSRQAHARFPDSPLAGNSYFSSLARRADALGEEGQRPKALAAFLEARNLARDLLTKHPGQTDLEGNLASLLNNLGILQRDIGQLRDALASYTEARDLRQRQVNRDPGVVRYRAGLARALSNMANAHRDLGERADAVACYAHAARLRRALHEQFPRVVDHQVELASTLLNLGILHHRQGQLDEARAAFTEALRLRRRLAQDHPKAPAYQNDLAQVLNSLGIIDRPRDVEASIRHYTEAAVIRRALVKAQPSVPRYQTELVELLHNHGYLLVFIGRLDGAAALFDEAITLGRSLNKKWPGNLRQQVALADALGGRAKVLEEQRRLSEARERLDEALAVMPAQPRSAAARQKRADRHVDRAAVFAALGQLREAEADWGRAMALSPPAARDDVRLGRAYGLALAGDYLRAAAAARALRGRPGLPTYGHYQLACTLALCSRSAQADGSRPLPLRERLAESYATQAIALLEKAVEAGYFQPAFTRGFLSRQEALHSLRDRDDFRRLQARIEGR